MAFQYKDFVSTISTFFPFFQYKDFVGGFFPPVEFALGIPSLIGSSIFLVLIARAYYLVRKDRNEEKLENNN
jgi:hypothetical protein